MTKTVTKKYTPSCSSKNLLTESQVYLLLFPYSQDHRFPLFLHLPEVATYSQLAISSCLVSPTASSNHVTDANNNNKCSQRTTNSNCHHMAFWLSCCWLLCDWLCCWGVAFLYYSREHKKISQSKNSWSSSCIYSDHTLLTFNESSCKCQLSQVTTFGVYELYFYFDYMFS